MGGQKLKKLQKKFISHWQSPKKKRLSEWGDRLDLLADRFYGDVSLWWIIAVSNPNKIEFGSLLPDPGLQIRIPADPNLVIDKYYAKNLSTSFNVGN